MSNVIHLWPTLRQIEEAADYERDCAEWDQRPIIAPLEPPVDYEREDARGVELVALCGFFFGLGCLATALAALVLSRFM